MPAGYPDDEPGGPGPAGPAPDAHGPAGPAPDAHGPAGPAPGDRHPGDPGRAVRDVLTRASDDARVDVVGTLRYQDTLWRIVGPPTFGPGGRAHWHGTAWLTPEPGNPFDPNAVRVDVDGETVGYLSRDVAAGVQRALRTLARRGIAVDVPCYAKGGFLLRDGGRAHVGLSLRVDPDAVVAAARAIEGATREAAEEGDAGEQGGTRQEGDAGEQGERAA